MSIKRWITISVGVIGICVASVTQAEDSTHIAQLQTDAPAVRAWLTPDSMSIGDWFRVRVEIDKDVMQQVDFPVFGDHRMTDRIEVISESQVDTLKRDGRKITLAKEYIMTTFDEGMYNLGPFPVLYADKNIVDTLWSADSLRMLVTTFDIDTTKQQIFDIKPQFDVPLKFGEISGYILCGLLLVLLAVGIYYLIQRKRQGKPLLGKEKPELPGHVVAIMELEKLHTQKLWQSNRHKQYYTRLTDILRKYLESRFGIQALEMTSDEILAQTQKLLLTERASGQLRDLLKLADLVKFAKLTPSAEENEEAYDKAYYFVEDTKPEAEAPADQTTTDNLSDDENNKA